RVQLSALLSTPAPMQSTDDFKSDLLYFIEKYSRGFYTYSLFYTRQLNSLQPQCSKCPPDVFLNSDTVLTNSWLNLTSTFENFGSSLEINFIDTSLRGLYHQQTWIRHSLVNQYCIEGCCLGGEAFSQLSRSFLACLRYFRIELPQRYFIA